MKEGVYKGIGFNLTYDVARTGDETTYQLYCLENNKLHQLSTDKKELEKQIKNFLNNHAFVEHYIDKSKGITTICNKCGSTNIILRQDFDYDYEGRMFPNGVYYLECQGCNETEEC